MKSLLAGVPATYIATLAQRAEALCGFALPSPVSDLSALLSVDPVTLQYIVGPPCCSICAGTFIVNHYQPVAIIECIKGSADSITNYAGVGLNHSYDHNHLTYDVRVWEIAPWMLDPPMAYQSCKLCGIDSAKISDFGDPSDLQMALGIGCVDTSSIVKSLISSVNQYIPNCFPKILYDSTLDTNWDSGCQDAALAMTVPPNSCELAAWVPGLNSLIESTFGYTPCIGAWGANYPRHQANSWNDPRLGSAVSAYRGISLAQSYGLFPFSTDISKGKLQPIYPQAVPGAQPGTLAGTKSVLCNSVALEGDYGYVWWVDVTCCKTINEIYGLCTPALC